MKRMCSALLALALCLSLSVPAFASSSAFSDVSSSYWAKDAIAYAVDKGYFAGTSSTTFTPEGAMTRSMLWVVLSRMDGVDNSGASPWYQKGLEWAKSTGISDGSNPSKNITREQFAAMLYRYAEYTDVSTTAKASALSSYTDKSSISSYATTAVAWAVTNGIITGTTTTTISPKGNATRAQVATMLMRYDQKFGSEKTKTEDTDTSALSMSLLDWTGVALENNSIVAQSDVIVAMGLNYGDDVTVASCSSSDTSVATVSNQSFYVSARAKKAGKTTITVTTSDGRTGSIVLTVTSSSSESGNNNSSDDDTYLEMRNEIVELINGVREDDGCSNLAVSDILMEVAQIRAEECAEMGSLNNHIRPNGEYGAGSVIHEKGYTITTTAGIGEILTTFTAGDESIWANCAVTNWKNSSGHKKIMVDSEKTIIGVGVAVANGQAYCCAVIC